MSWGCVEMPWIALAEGSLAEVLTFFRAGAADFVAKPVDVSALLRAVRDVLAHSEEPHALCYPHTKKKPCQRYNIVGSAPKTVRLKRLIELVAPTEARVLVMGENGTGKELVARQIHLQSNRSAGPFVEVNCAAIPSELIESELFGHEKGAFTSAIKQRKGKFEQADGGTLFMDEIGDMSLSAQAKVLRALQERKISRVGSDRDIDVDVRVIAATNKNLEKEIREGNFREDLYHRIGVILIKVPPLRERKGDVAILVEHFLESICKEYRIPTKSIDTEAVENLSEMRWSGNIRELRNVIERLVVLSGPTITTNDIEQYC
jgi:DNA-binding NtrC family response regulator